MQPTITSAPAPHREAGRTRVALVHEWLTIPGGSETVLLRLLHLFPDAEIFTSIYDPEPWPRELTDRPVHVSFLNRVPRARRLYPRLLPLMNAAFESFDLSAFDLVISSSHSCAKNVLTRPETLHICYCHTPMRHAWQPGFLAGESIGPVERLAARAMLGRIRTQDLVGSFRPDQFVANSSHVAARIAKYYRRDSRVIHPPVEIGALLDAPREPGDYYAYVGRLVPYKRADLAIAACRRLGRRLKVVGSGRGLDAAQLAASPDIEILGNLPDADLRRVLSGARALLFPGEEDFGIVPVEAQAAGVPVIALGVGGALDTVIDGETGVLFDEATPESLMDAILRFEDMTFDPDDARANAMRFTPEHFDSGMRELVAELGSPALVR